MPLPTQTVPADAQAPAWRSLLVTGACLLGVAALLFGLLEHGVALHERRQLLVLVVAGTVAAVALNWAARRSWRLVVLMVLAALVTMFGLGAVAMLLVTGATTLALGILAFGAPVHPVPLALALRSASGLAIMVAVLQPMMHLRVNFAPVYLGLSALALVAVHRDLARLAKDLWFALAARPAPGSGRATVVLLLAALLLATLHAAMPESGYDALSNHLIVVRWVDWHGYWHFDPAVFDRALTPRGAGWLFAWAHVLGGEPAMKLLNAAAFWLTAGIVLAHTAADPEPPPPWLAPFGLLALAVTPLTIWVMAMLFEETVTTLFVTAALASLALAYRSPEVGLSRSGGQLMGLVDYGSAVAA
ncbi:hypothetical protein [Siccirubricoccus sp. G192]|uniref:hypothetical protein n=1 Tax=Siccirubricoccus sp. G192 TaxID=2849651 RepID=UPI001C2BD415|nr:hypothetical protein [Siccirubricoccus sp. G192]MBV1796458.1 hypothetical protein [Siccirubricoccus sp. G192]